MLLIIVRAVLILVLVMLSVLLVNIGTAVPVFLDLAPLGVTLLAVLVRARPLIVAAQLIPVAALLFINTLQVMAKSGMVAPGRQLARRFIVVLRLILIVLRKPPMLSAAVALLPVLVR